MPTAARTPGSTFLNGIDDVFTIMVHETDGWPSRNKVNAWIRGYTHAPVATGPQSAVWSDGTVMQLVDLPFLTHHGEFLNARSLGTETGHGSDGRFEGIADPVGGPENPDHRPPDIAPDVSPAGIVAGTVRSRWHPLSAQPEDVPGAKLYAADQVADAPHEVLLCWWSASTYTTAGAANIRYLFPSREPPGTVPANAYRGHTGHPLPAPPAATLMIFSEAQYRSWSLLARFLAETFLVPRNLPLLPWALRSENARSPAGAGISPPFRPIALADPNFSSIVRDIGALGFTEPMFQRANLASFRTTYDGAHANAGTVNEPTFSIRGNNKALNRAWLNLFKSFRGFIGHGFAGSAILDDHDCPGPMFDWYRFARELWDWWWYPFDFDPAFATTAVPKRALLNPVSDTVLIEHFFENTPSDNRPDPYIARTTPPGGPPGGLLGTTSSPSTFQLEAGTPIYAMANGELVAARLLQPGPGVNMSFMLVRHEVFHQPDPSGQQALLARFGVVAAPANVAMTGRIDYTVEPEVAYSLYMHLGGCDQMNFDQPVEANPGWLNRVLVRQKECDLAIDAAGNLHQALQAMPANDFTAPPPAGRPTLIELLRIDKDRLGRFLARLRAGNVATETAVRLVEDAFVPTPIKVLLGDFIGTAGTIRVVNGVPTPGVLVEVFSPTLIAPLFFTEVTGKTGFDVPANVAHAAMPYVSEWARPLSAAEQAAARALGADPDLMMWWPDAISDQFFLLVDPNLPLDGRVYHYSPLDFMRWLNGVTWASEWPKYRVKDAAGNDMPQPDKPPVRRISF